MANHGSFDAELSALSWFEPYADVLGWFDYGLAFDHPLLAVAAVTDLEVEAAAVSVQGVAPTLQLVFSVAPAEISVAAVAPTLDLAYDVGATADVEGVPPDLQYVFGVETAEITVAANDVALVLNPYFVIPTATVDVEATAPDLQLTYAVEEAIAAVEAVAPDLAYVYAVDPAEVTVAAPDVDLFVGLSLEVEAAELTVEAIAPTLRVVLAQVTPASVGVEGTEVGLAYTGTGEGGEPGEGTNASSVYIYAQPKPKRPRRRKERVKFIEEPVEHVPLPLVLHVSPAVLFVSGGEVSMTITNNTTLEEELFALLDDRELVLV